MTTPAAEPRHVLEVLDRAAAAWPDAPALQARRDGQWQTTSWSSYRAEVRRAARGMIGLGLLPGQAVAILSRNRPEWFVANLAAIAAGGVPAGVYTTSTPEQCRYLAQHSGAALAVVESREHVSHFDADQPPLPELRARVVLDGPGDRDALGWQQLLERGDGVPESELERRLAALEPDSLATLIYTSGTTGPPKAVCLSHRNLIWTAQRVVDESRLRFGDRLLSYLPLCHIAEQLISHHPPMHVGACTAFAPSPERLAEDLREVRPHLFFGVPRVWEKLQSAIQIGTAARPPLQRRLGAWARGVGLEAGRAEQRGERTPLLLPLARRLVHAPLARRLGLDRARVCATSAAPIALATLEYFLGLGIPILEVYGMSECTGPATSSRRDRYRTGSSGVALPGAELRIAPDGEILMRGPHVFSGYYRDPEATRAALDPEGWLHSGDIGQLDADGFLRVTDRKKELIITAGGKNVAPQLIEGKLRQIPLVSQAVVIGDRRPYLTALLALDPARLPALAARLGSPAHDAAAAAGCGVIRAHLEQQLAAVNATLARYETLKRFHVLPRELNVECDELTPTLKLKRRVIAERWAEAIEALYPGETGGT